MTARRLAFGLMLTLVGPLVACDDDGGGAGPALDAMPDAMPDGMASDMSYDMSDAIVDVAVDGMLDDMLDGSTNDMATPPPDTRCSDPEASRCAYCPIVAPVAGDVLFVAPDGDDATGDGSRERPFGTVAHAVGRATPGTEVRLLPGVYPGGVTLTDVHGTREAPIIIGGDPDALELPVIDATGSAEGLHLIRPRWVMLRKLTVRGASANGINVDDGGAYDDPDAARYVAVRDVVIEDIGPAGNRDCLKLSGLDDFEVLDSTFRRCGDGGSGVDMVGCHDGVIRGNVFEELGASGVQAKGGTARIRIANNHFRDAGARPINMGGSTGFEFFRPPLDGARPNAEAREVVVVSNHIIGGETAAAFVGCVECIFAHNTVIEPTRWLLRILQETTTGDAYTFEPARGGWVTGNIFVFDRGTLRTAVNVGGGTDAPSFRFTHNLFYAVDDPERSTPQLPVDPVGSIVGLDPLLDASYVLGDDGPAVGAGDPAAGAVLDESLGGGCYGSPPSLGANEAPGRLGGA